MKNVSKTKITGIFGYPIKHTLSPAMHNAGFRALKLNYNYFPFEVKPEDLGPAVEAIKILNIAGVNITIPHKSEVLKFLDSIDPLAAKIGSVNTIVNNNGKLLGYNTDATGFIRDLKGKGFNPKNKRALLLGAGGAGRAVAAALSWAGAKSILITDSDENKARNLAKSVERARFVPLKDFRRELAGCGLLVNATPNGMHKGDKAVLNAGEFPPDIFFYDLVYNRETETLKNAKKAGASAAGGLGMLLNQGALAFELWTKRKAPIDVMNRALKRALK
ncbi:MAG TPA: shikimate dehydrogenase [Elusimicrobia bacterium]|nr:MAG: shikimate dehydrogenase [Elusimicrobia bacterium RIFOXYA12_FULL_49_49]OGS09489.1 MAG: shikimate dehydrogenase [Elusimicrobia bacterium RIFOXYA1_FULL_47_7]OGS10631.1 MAG: shikimate dehydrogenase [Elusimicrobia bacterium RIFOXYB1_FULL_48_9]OGS15859.1 MAG: shikimate dehydrogenase [Elusimicrobia bacterium RIFOXYA2_FULL_47_53]OGS27153.1 MAG: shikimate dehydrogenase [Elusimicrobia bacterium RIFOXYB12_FULL_50_12]OGS31192.1 MAG: shikimate dehydrogenase [Elusimicrobia bacterium RIFOXYB2_FULL_46